MEKLNQIEVRVVGSLIEKELATPEYYPMTVNALTAACNQKSNRSPLMNLGEVDVVKALDSLRFKQFVVVSSEGGRVPKYRHLLGEKLRLNRAELSLLCELLIRGPQTVGELRTRAERLENMADIATTEGLLQELAERTPPLVIKLPRQPGHKEARYAHLFAGEPEADSTFTERGESIGEEIPVINNSRMAQLEQEVASLRLEVADLKTIVENLLKQLQ